MKIKNSIFPKNIRDTKKMLRSKIVYLKEIYQFPSNHVFIGVIFLFINEKSY